MKPRCCMYGLQILHIQPTGFQRRIFALNIGKDFDNFISLGTSDHVFGPRKEMVSVPLYTERMFEVLKSGAFRRLYGLVDIGKTFFINLGDKSFFTLNISVASLCKFLWVVDSE